MKRTILTPAQAAWLDATMLRNRSAFGGWSMTATPPEGGDPTPPAASPPAPAPAPPAAAAEKPWGDDANFDPEKAWKLIEGLKADKEKLTAREFLSDDQKTKLAEYDRLKEESKTELEKAQEAAGQVAPLTAENLRLKVALEKGLTGDKAGLIARLQGNTVEEIAADADNLLALLGTPAGPAPTEPQPPKPNPGQGTSANGTPSAADQAAQAVASGNWRESIQLKSQALVQASDQAD